MQYFRCTTVVWFASCRISQPRFYPRSRIINPLLIVGRISAAILKMRAVPSVFLLAQWASCFRTIFVRNSHIMLIMSGPRQWTWQYSYQMTKPVPISLLRPTILCLVHIFRSRSWPRYSTGCEPDTIRSPPIDCATQNASPLKFDLYPTGSSL